MISSLLRLNQQIFPSKDLETIIADDFLFKHGNNLLTFKIKNQLLLQSSASIPMLLISLQRSLRKISMRMDAHAFLATDYAENAKEFRVAN